MNTTDYGILKGPFHCHRWLFTNVACLCVEREGYEVDCDSCRASFRSLQSKQMTLIIIMT